MAVPINGDARKPVTRMRRAPGTGSIVYYATATQYKRSKRI